MMDKPKKKLNKQKREQKRIERANTYELGFNHGYRMGLEEGRKQWERENHATKDAQR